MRLMATASVAILALSTAALAQVANTPDIPANNAASVDQEEIDHNALMHHSPREMIPMDHNFSDPATPQPNPPKTI